MPCCDYCSQLQMLIRAVNCQSSHGPFTLTKTETDTKTGSDKMATVPNSFGVLVQYEDLHTILYRPFLSVSVSVSVSISVNTPLQTQTLPRRNLW